MTERLITCNQILRDTSVFSLVYSFLSNASGHPFLTIISTYIIVSNLINEIWVIGDQSLGKNQFCVHTHRKKSPQKCMGRE